MSKQSLKKQYKVINWAEYNQALVNRGNFTLWVSEEVIQQWQHENDDIKVGRPFVYSDLAIETLLTLRELYHLTYRSTEGFAKGLLGLVQIQVLIPDFTTMAKRAKTLAVALNATQVKGAVCLVVDSTGLIRLFKPVKVNVMRKREESKIWRALCQLCYPLLCR